tara:strand:+ start:922 stop:1416 length:495 start_codon:yes stop_codon:yes gene_type:complete
MTYYFNKKNLSLIIIFLLIFFFDRLTKIYILNLAESGNNVNIYLNEYINFYLIWNEGIAFGLLSSGENNFYNFITTIIIIINLIILYLIFKTKDYRSYFLLMIISGSSGNLFDRLYYKAVPDFIDLHIGNFHWFIFNVADIFISTGVLCLILVEIFFNKNLTKL